MDDGRNRDRGGYAPPSRRAHVLRCGAAAARAASRAVCEWAWNIYCWWVAWLFPRRFCTSNQMLPRRAAALLPPTLASSLHVLWRWRPYRRHYSRSSGTSFKSSDAAVRWRSGYAHQARAAPRSHGAFAPAQRTAVRCLAGRLLLVRLFLLSVIARWRAGVVIDRRACLLVEGDRHSTHRVEAACACLGKRVRNNCRAAAHGGSCREIGNLA